MEMGLLLRHPPLSWQVGLQIPLQSPHFSQRVGGTHTKCGCTYTTPSRPFYIYKSRQRNTQYPLYVKRRVDDDDDDEEELTPTTKMGVEKQVLKAGNGPKPVRGQNVTVHCTGFGKNGDLGQKFWSTKDAGQQPFTFKIGHGSVIKGWDEGVADMQIGEVARLQCTPDYAYGPSGFPAWGILPNSVLVFEIEVLSAQ